ELPLPAPTLASSFSNASNPGPATGHTTCPSTTDPCRTHHSLSQCSFPNARDAGSALPSAAHTGSEIQVGRSDTGMGVRASWAFLVRRRGLGAGGGSAPAPSTPSALGPSPAFPNGFGSAGRLGGDGLAGTSAW